MIIFAVHKIGIVEVESSDTETIGSLTNFLKALTTLSTGWGFLFKLMSKDIKHTKRQLVFEKYEGKCAYCGCELNKNSFNVDHIQPVHRGTHQQYLKVQKGTNHIDNLNPSCFSCNSSKFNLTIEQWREQLELKTKKLLKDSAQFRIALRYGLIKECSKSVVFYFEKIGGV